MDEEVSDLSTSIVSEDKTSEITKRDDSPSIEEEQDRNCCVIGTMISECCYTISKDHEHAEECRNEMLHEIECETGCPIG